MPFLSLLWLIPVCPLVGALLLLCVGERLDRGRRWLAGAVGSGAALGAFVWSVGAVAQVSSLHERTYEAIYFRWMPGFSDTGWHADWGLLLDPLSAVMTLVITGIGFLIHWYAVGYMVQERGRSRFFAYLNLFVAFMLLLVLANNYLLLFAGWEGVGLCSYLLIGYFFHRRSATDAANKAFLVNRAGDAAFLLGLALMLAQFGTVQYTALQPRWAAGGSLTMLAVLLLIGAAGKSAQFPLHVWLPDAMEAPTPVSALIHAATMVTAGVYLIARSSGLYQLTPGVSTIIAVVGAVTALMAALLALAQNDIKRLLAYSTVSQLGYMFMALGAGAYWVAVFHLFTHAFFKALLFLGAGSVIHALDGEQDLQRMGGLRQKLPLTHAAMLVGSLALAGVPGFAGFFSKDEILYRLFQSPVGFRAVYGVGLVTAFLSALYMGRLMVLAFYGKARGTEQHAHEGPLSMRAPLAVLMLGSLAAGWIGVPKAWMAFGERFRLFELWLEPVFPASPVTEGPTAPLTVASIVVAFAGLAWAYRRYSTRPQTTAPALLRRRFYLDEVYDALFVRGLGRGLGGALQQEDQRVIDGAVNGTGWLARSLSRLSLWVDQWLIDGLARLAAVCIQIAVYPARLLQAGTVQSYAFYVALGALALFAFLLVHA